MKVSELIKVLQQKCKGDDPEIEFLAYRWRDDLEYEEYLPARFSQIRRYKGEIRIFVDT